MRRLNRAIDLIRRWWKDYRGADIWPVHLNAAHRMRLQEGNCVVMVELARYHAETLASFARLFEDLGFDQLVLVRRGSAFSQMLTGDDALGERPEVIEASIKQIRRLLREPALNNARLIFINTEQVAYGARGWINALDYLHSADLAQIPTISLVHNPEHAGQLPVTRAYKCHQRISLGSQGLGPAVPATRFWRPIQAGGAPGTKRILAVGASARSESALIELELALRSVKSREPIEVHVVGCTDAPSVLKIGMHSLVRHPRLEQHALEERMAEASFFLPMLSVLKDDDGKYLKGVMSGGMQIVWAANLVSIWERPFASAYHVPENCAISYELGEVHVGLARASELTPSQEQAMRRNVMMWKSQVEQEAINTIRSISRPKLECGELEASASRATEE